MEGAVQLSPLFARGTLRFEGTGITGSRVCAVFHLLRLLLGTKWTEWLTLRADIHILRRIVGELGGSEKGRHVLPIRQRNRGPDACVFQDFDVLDGAVLRVAGHVARPQFPAEAGAKEHFFYKLTAPDDIYTLSLLDALPSRAAP